MHSSFSPGVTSDPIFTSPSTNSSHDSSIRIAYTLPEAPTSGTVQIEFEETTTHDLITFIMNNDTSVSFDIDVNSIFSLNIISQTASSIPSGIYDVTLSYQDLSGNPEASVTSSHVTIGATTSTLPTISTSNVNPETDADSAVVTVTLSSTSSSEVSVDYTTVDGTAKAGEDYTEKSGTLTWSAGNTDDKTITIPLTTSESSDGKKFSVVLSNASGATLLEDTSVVTLSSSEDKTTQQKSSGGGCSLRR